MNQGFEFQRPVTVKTQQGRTDIDQLFCFGLLGTDQWVSVCHVQRQETSAVIPSGEHRAFWQTIMQRQSEGAYQQQTADEYRDLAAALMEPEAYPNRRFAHITWSEESVCLYFL